MFKTLPSFWFKVIFFVTLLLVTFFFLIPLPAQGEPLINDKVMHGLVFFVLAFLMDRAYPQIRFIKLLAPTLAAYGFLIEVVQGISGYRHFSMLDFGADIVGIVLYVFIIGMTCKIFNIEIT